MEDYKELLLNLRRGADIYAYDLAYRIQRLKQEHPTYVEIVESTAMSGHRDELLEKLPYFGAIATKEGIDYAES